MSQNVINNNLIEPDILNEIISNKLINYIESSHETDFDKFISRGINSFLRRNINIRKLLQSFIIKNIVQIDAVHILTDIIYDSNLHTSQTSTLIKVYNKFARSVVISTLFNPQCYLKYDKSFAQSKKATESLQDSLIHNSYLKIPKVLISIVIRKILKYIREIIESLRVDGFSSYVVGHFIESIITNTKYYSTYDTLKRSKCLNKENNGWIYTEDDFDKYSKRIEHVIYNEIKWSNFKGNCYMYSTIPYAYIDYVVKLELPENVFICRINNILERIYTVISDFNTFQQAITGYFRSVLLISSETNNKNVVYNQLGKYKIVKFKGSIITDTPLHFENDIITAHSIVEIKTGITETKKNMSKLVLENIILNSNKVNTQYKNVIIFNPRSNIISFISANKFKH